MKRLLKVFNSWQKNLPQKKLLLPLALILIILSNAFLAFIPFSLTSLIPGDDAPYYLSISNQINNTGYTNHAPVGRLIFFYFPVILSKLFGMSIILFLKIYIIIIGTLILLSTYIFSENIFGSKVAIITTLFTLLCPAYWRIKANMYSNYLAIAVLIIVLYLFNLYLRESKTRYIIILAFFSGLEFYIHNLTAFPLLGIILISLVLLYGVKILRKEIELSKAFATIAIFLISALLVSGLYFYDFFFPINKNIDPIKTGAMSYKRYKENFPLVKPVPFLLSTFPLNKYMFSTYFPNFLIGLYLIGLTLMLLLLFRKDERKLIVVFVSSLVFFILTQQGYFGLDVVPSRFVLNLFPFICLSGAFVVYQFTNKLFKDFFVKNKVFLFMFLVLFIKTNFHIAVKWAVQYIKPAPLPKKQLAYQEVQKTLASIPNSRVIFYEENKYWFGYFAPEIQYSIAEYYLTCGFSRPDMYPEHILNSSDLFSSNDTSSTKKILERRKDIVGPLENEYIFIDKSETCRKIIGDSPKEIYWEKFDSDAEYFEKIFENENYSLYRIKYENI